MTGQINYGNYRIGALEVIFQIGRSTVYDHVKKGLLPRPIKNGRTSLWLREEIDALIESRRADRDSKFEGPQC
jgi:predicted DNA-binding transcriptional regulator AlpA